jgi:hypothetical protein
VRAEQGIVNTSSIFAAEGTAAHELGELVLNSGGYCHEWEGKPLIENDSITVTYEMVSNVQQYVDYVRSIKGELLVETRVDFSDWVSDGFGTCDSMILNGDTLHIVDLKYGKGIRVDAEENTQAILYALGALSDFGMIYNIQIVTVSICQPRLDHISEWSLSRDELMLWGERIKQGAELALSDDAPRVPSEKACQWCKAKATCPALFRLTEQTILSGFDNVSAPNPDTLSDDQLRAALDSKKLICAWLDSVEDLIKSRLERGAPFDGFKLVAGRSLRAWVSDTVAVELLTELLGDDLYTRKLISVVQAEKLLGKKHSGLLEQIVIKPEGAPTIAPESDKRQAINVSTNDFDCV